MSGEVRGMAVIHLPLWHLVLICSGVFFAFLLLAGACYCVCCSGSSRTDFSELKDKEEEDGLVAVELSSRSHNSDQDYDNNRNCPVNYDNSNNYNNDSNRYIGNKDNNDDYYDYEERGNEKLEEGLIEIMENGGYCPSDEDEVHVDLSGDNAFLPRSSRQQHYTYNPSTPNIKSKYLHVTKKKEEGRERGREVSQTKSKLKRALQEGNIEKTPPSRRERNRDSAVGKPLTAFSDEDDDISTHSYSTHHSASSKTKSLYAGQSNKGAVYSQPWTSNPIVMDDPQHQETSTRNSSNEPSGSYLSSSTVSSGDRDRSDYKPSGRKRVHPSMTEYSATLMYSNDDDDDGMNGLAL